MPRGCDTVAGRHFARLRGSCADGLSAVAARAPSGRIAHRLAVSCVPVQLIIVPASPAAQPTPAGAAGDRARLSAGTQRTFCRCPCQRAKVVGSPRVRQPCGPVPDLLPHLLAEATTTIRAFCIRSTATSAAAAGTSVGARTHLICTGTVGTCWARLHREPEPDV